MQTYVFVLQMPGNKAYMVPCERLVISIFMDYLDKPAVDAPFLRGFLD